MVCRSPAGCGTAQEDFNEQGTTVTPYDMDQVPKPLLTSGGTSSSSYQLHMHGAHCTLNTVRALHMTPGSPIGREPYAHH